MMALPEAAPGLILAALALLLGGVLKGATGAGAPIIAVPVIALFFDVQTAVVTLLVPNLLSNVIQGWRYRAHLPQGHLPWSFAGAGLAGALLGSVMLAKAAPRLLLLMVAAVVFLYIAFRLARPGWRLAMRRAEQIVLPVGVVAGMLQGATGVSAPVSITFLNAIGLPRASFAAAISLFFATMTLVQIPALAHFGFVTWTSMAFSFGALLLILAAMPLGEALARRLPVQFFDRMILGILALVALRIVLTA